MLRTLAARARTHRCGPRCRLAVDGQVRVSAPRPAPPGGGRRVGSLADWTYLRAGVVTIAAAVVFAIAVPLAAGVFDHVRPFDINDPGSEVERAYAAYEQAQGVVSDADVALLVSGPAAARTADVERRLTAVNGIADAYGPEDDPRLRSADGGEVLVLGRSAAGVNRVDLGEAVRTAFEGQRGVTAGGVAVAAFEIGQPDRARHATDRGLRGARAAPAPALRLPVAAGGGAAAAAGRLLDHDLTWRRYRCLDQRYRHRRVLPAGRHRPRRRARDRLQPLRPCPISGSRSGVVRVHPACAATDHRQRRAHRDVRGADHRCGARSADRLPRAVPALDRHRRRPRRTDERHRRARRAAGRARAARSARRFGLGARRGPHRPATRSAERRLTLLAAASQHV